MIFIDGAGQIIGVLIEKRGPLAQFTAQWANDTMKLFCKLL
jgi:hypothetical protein